MLHAGVLVGPEIENSGTRQCKGLPMKLISWGKRIYIQEEILATDSNSREFPSSQLLSAS